MKKAEKVLIVLLCAVLIMGATVAGTFAFLTSRDSVQNTFTIGNVKITMDEAKVTEYGVKDGDSRVGANTYKLVPGQTYTKDPTVYVDGDSEPCFVFVKIENGLGSDAALTMESGWAKIEETGNTSVWVYGTAEAPKVLAANSSATPFTSFAFGQNADPSAYSSAAINVTAYAIQSTDLDVTTSAAIWALLK